MFGVLYLYVGSVNAILRLLLMIAIIFGSKAGVQTIGEKDGSYFARIRMARGNSDIILGDKPQVITLTEKTNLSYFYKVTDHLNFLVVQAHTQYRNLTLSAHYDQEANTNSDTAILKTVSYPWFLLHELNRTLHRLDFILKPPNGISVQTLVTVVTYSGKVPVPGGCCLTCSMEMDPNLVITRKQYYKSILSFPLANVYDYNTSDCSGQTGSKPHHYRLQYSIYQYFLEEGNLENDELFDGISKMLTPSKVKENGNKVRDWNPQVDVLPVVFDTKRGQGIILNVLVLDPTTNAESVYSPVVTYGCSFTAKVDGCDSLGSIANIVLACCGSLFGLFICFFGQRFYRFYIFGSGLTLFSFLGFVMLTNETEWTHDVRMIGSVCIGIVGGSLVYLLWWWTGYRHLVLYICGLPFGFLLSALVFFTPFGSLHYWNNGINFWTVLFCMSITIPCIFLICLKTFAILASSLVGAYGFVVGIDTFIKSSMTYIILSVIMRATVDDFVKYDIPFQSKDYILSVVWSILTILGLIVQFITSKGKPVLPNEAPRKKRAQEAKRNRQEAEVTCRVPQDNENDCLPVLINSRHNNTRIIDSEIDEEEFPILIESRSFLPRRTPGTNESEQRSTRYGTNVVC